MSDIKFKIVYHIQSGMLMLICVTGANGFIGKNLVAKLVCDGYRVRVLSRKAKHEHPECVEIFIGDLTSTSIDLSKFLSGCNILFHCAGEINNIHVMQALHIDGMRRLLKSAISESSLGRGLRWVQLSSVGVYGRNLIDPSIPGVIDEKNLMIPLGIYEATKAGADELLLTLDAPKCFSYSILRPSNVFGIGMPNTSLANLIKSVSRGIFFYIGKPGAIATYVHVDVVVDALLLCGSDPRAKNKIYNLSDDCVLELLIEKIANSINVRKPFLRMPKRLIELLVLNFGGYIKLPLTISRINSLVSRTTYPSDLLVNDLNFVIQRPTLVAIEEYSKYVIEGEINHACKHRQK